MTTILLQSSEAETKRALSVEGLHDLVPTRLQHRIDEPVPHAVPFVGPTDYPIVAAGEEDLIDFLVHHRSPRPVAQGQRLPHRLILFGEIDDDGIARGTKPDHPGAIERIVDRGNLAQRA